MVTISTGGQFLLFFLLSEVAVWVLGSGGGVEVVGLRHAKY